MAGIHFDITADNSHFIQTIDQIQNRIRQTSSVLKQVGEGLNVKGVENQILSLTKVIQENESKILQSKQKIATWLEQATEARDKGDIHASELMQGNISRAISHLQKLVEETNRYKDALSEINALNGQSQGVRAAMFFGKQEDFEAYNEMLRKREEIQSRIANFDKTGMSENNATARIVEMRSKLTILNAEINKTELAAANAAQALGTNGERAAEAAVRYYELNKAVEEQVAKINDLQLKLNTASDNLVTAVNAKDVEGARDAQIEYDNLTESLQSAKMELINLQNEQKRAGDDFKEFGDTTQTLRMQLRECTMELTALTLQYRQMSAEERNSAEGKEMKAKMEELAEQAGELRDTLSDVSKEISKRASDTSALDGLAGGINVVTSSIGAFHGVLAMVGVDEKDLLDIQAKLQASLAISNALTVVQNQLQRESALMIGITTIQKKAAVIAEELDTAAKGKNIIVTTAATVAQRAFNAVAKANPYVLLATAILTVVGALAAFTLGSKKAEDEEKANQEALEKSKKAVEDYRNTLSNSYAGMMSKYSDLRREWEALSSEHEKTAWIKNNKSKFEELGLSVTNVKSAEDVFRNNTDNVVDSFKRRAEAAALAAQMTELYRQQMDLEQQYQNRLNAKGVSAGDKVKQSDIPGVVTEDRGQGTYNQGTLKRAGSGYVYTEAGANAFNEDLKKSDAQLNQINDDWKEVGERIDEADKKLKQLGNTGKTTSGGSGGKSTRDLADRQAKEKQQAQKHQEEMKKLEDDAARAREDASIAAIQSQAQRERAEREAQHNRTIADLKRQEDDIYKKIYQDRKTAYDIANKGKKNATPYELTEEGSKGYLSEEARAAMRESFNQKGHEDELNQFNTQMSIINAQLDEAHAKRQQQIKAERDAQIQALNDYIKEYGTIDQKRAAIEEEYKKKIEEAGTIGEKLTLQAKMEVDLSALDSKKIADTLNLEDIFNDLGVQSIEKMKSMRDALREQLSNNNLGFEEYKVIAEQIDKITEAIVEKENRENEILGIRIPGETTVKRLKQEQEEAMKNALKAAEALAKATQEEEKRREKVSNLLSENGINYKGEITASNSEDILKAIGLNPELQEKVKKALEDLSSAERNTANATKKKEKADSKATTVTDKLNDALGNARQRVGEFAESLEQINANIQSLPGLMESLGLGDTAAGEMIGGIANAANGAMGAMADFASGNYVGAAMKAVDTIKNLGETFGAWSSSNRAEIEKENAKLAAATSVNTEAINRLTEEMKKASPSEAYKSFEEAQKMMKQNEEYAMNVMHNNASMYDGGHSLWADWVDDLGRAGRDFGKQLYDYLGKTDRDNSYDIGSMVRDFTAEDWNKLLKEKPEWMKQLSEYILQIQDEGNYNGIFQDILDFANEYSKEAYEDLWRTFQEAVTGVSFDGFKDKFKSALLDMEKDAEDFSKDFTQMLYESLLNAQIEKLYGERMKDLYDSWANALTSGDTLDENEIAELQRKEEELTKDMLATRDTLANLMGINDTTAETVEKNIDIIKDAFSSLISETEPDMEEWGKNVKNSIIENLIEAMVFGEEFKKWMKQLTEDFNQIWAQYEAGLLSPEMFSKALAGLESDIDAKGGEIAEIIKTLKESLGYAFDNEDNPFSGLRDSFLDTLTNIEDDAKAFKKRLTEIMVQDLIDKNILGSAFTIDDKTFENFDKYLEDWNDRYKKAVESGNQEAIEALIDELVRAREITIEAAEQWREKLKEVADDETFKNLSDSWVSTLMDMSKTAEDWAENIGKIMAEQIIKQMIVPTYIQPLLDNLQKVFNGVIEGATGTDENGNKIYDWKSIIGSDELQAQLDILKEQYPEIQAIVKQIMEAFGLDTSNYKYSGFSNIGDSILASLANAEESIELWSKDMGKQMAEDMAKAYIDATYGKQMEDINERWRKALEIDDAEARETALENIRRELEALYQTMDNDTSLQNLIDKFKELKATPLDDMRSTFLSDLMDMERGVEDFANDINRILTEAFINEFVLGDAFDEQLEEWKKRYRDIADSNLSEEQRAAELRKLQDAIAEYNEGARKQAQEIQDLMGYGEYKDQSATMNMADKITYDQADQLLGINLAQEITLEQILAEIRNGAGPEGFDFQPLYESLVNGITEPLGLHRQLNGIGGNDEQGELINATLNSFMELSRVGNENIVMQLAMANSHLQMIRDYSKKMSDQLELHMASMDGKLTNLNRL